jgi:hypothetical protein
MRLAEGRIPTMEGTLRVQGNSRGSAVEVRADADGIISHAGVGLLVELADRLGLTGALGWRAGRGRRRRHPEAWVLRDLAVMLADGGDCLSDLGVLRAQPELFGEVASTPTAWRVVERLATDPDGLARLRAARAHARARAWQAGAHPDSELLLVDLDATLVDAHSEKQGAAGTYKHTFGFHPLLAYLDRADGTGEPLAGVLRPGNAAANATADLVEVAELALAQLPALAGGQRVVMRSDSAGATLGLVGRMRELGVGFSIGLPIDVHVREAILTVPEPAWTAAVQPDRTLRDGAEVVELTGRIDLHAWPPGTRAICRREDPHPAPSCRSPTWMGTASKSSSPTSPRATSPSWSCATASAPASRTASAAPRRPGLPTCRLTACAATPSGWSWCCSLRTWSAGRRRCCWSASSASPSPRRYGIGCGTRPPAWSATPAA